MLLRHQPVPPIWHTHQHRASSKICSSTTHQIALIAHTLNQQHGHYSCTMEVIAYTLSLQHSPDCQQDAGFLSVGLVDITGNVVIDGEAERLAHLKAKGFAEERARSGIDSTPKWIPTPHMSTIGMVAHAAKMAWGAFKDIRRARRTAADEYGIYPENDPDITPDDSFSRRGSVVHHENLGDNDEYTQGLERRQELSIVPSADEEEGMEGWFAGMPAEWAGVDPSTIPPSPPSSVWSPPVKLTKAEQRRADRRAARAGRS